MGEIMKRILVLGATGFFGKNLVNKLLENNNYEVVAISRHCKDVYTNKDRLIAVNKDATKEEDLNSVMNGIDVVYCAISGESLPIVAEKLLKIMPLHNVSRLILMGAVGIYNEIPANLDDDDNIRNNEEQIPNLEAVEKLENSNLNYTIIRPGYLQDGDENDYVLTFKGSLAKGFESTISSVINLALKLIDNDNLFSRCNLSITKNQSI